MPGKKKSPIPDLLLERARELRSGQTDAEALLWRLLRDRSTGFKFRRQHLVENYVLDFYCHELKLAIELDGSQHADQKEKDDLRTRYLAGQGIRVLRFWNNDILLQTESVVAALWQEMNSGADSPHPGPLPEGEGV
jgi:type I restriction enzyme M protein